MEVKVCVVILFQLMQCIKNFLAILVHTVMIAQNGTGSLQVEINLHCTVMSWIQVHPWSLSTLSNKKEGVTVWCHHIKSLMNLSCCKKSLLHRCYTTMYTQNWNDQMYSKLVYTVICVKDIITRAVTEILLGSTIWAPDTNFSGACWCYVIRLNRQRKRLKSMILYNMLRT